ncbi:FAD-dependent oxidoreductase [Methylocystis parvus]|uniref:Rieske 2Fe-2S domain-containing protein n=1 Tax=Methylocystis parvus TaxID=134 RepID=A0A6B8M6U7_9HYPH|nr:FAD-dependent oxidoreductase [Methylocystis parvus]QGM98218.1 Rieske 2Fe-2S domain-containing protein [Methylocystis parvus]WBK01454.1 FAD-dependent oxidoreductase [Methylocystis parvus OBBP]
MSENGQKDGPDFARGVEAGTLVAGVPLRGHVGGEPAMMVWTGDEVFVIGADCTHYHGPLDEGLVVGDTIRCPWHHACFSLRTGVALRAPAFDALPRWRVEQRDGRIYASGKVETHAGPAPVSAPRSVVIVGAGAAGFAAAHALRAEGYDGVIEMIGADPAQPYDRPNLSKDYLAGTAQPEWLPLRDPAWYRDNGVLLRLGRKVETLDPVAKRLTLEGGEAVSFDALLLATGAEPVRLPIPGADRPNVFYLRSVADSDRIIAACARAKRVAVIGASFIGLEVAASLRTRGLDVHVVAPEAVPMARILGPELGAHVRKLHETRGVVFHLEDTAIEIGEAGLTLGKGGALPADFVVIGVGVRPNLALAEAAGLATDKGVLVDEYLMTSAADVYAAGDIARWPDKITGEAIRVEHWVVAERQGQTAARNILGRRERFDAAPFFWSQHYDQAISYVGHAPSWDRCEISGDPASGDCAAVFYKGERKLAVATLGRDLESLKAEEAFEKAIGALV